MADDPEGSWVTPYDDYSPQEPGLTHHEWMVREWWRERERSAAYLRSESVQGIRHAAGARRPSGIVRTVL